MRAMGVKLGPLTLWDDIRLSMFENTFYKGKHRSFDTGY